MEYIIKVSTKIQPHEDAERVFHSINNIFPDWKPDNIPKKEQYPTKRSALLVTGFSNSLDFFMKSVVSERILAVSYTHLTLPTICSV